MTKYYFHAQITSQIQPEYLFTLKNCQILPKLTLLLTFLLSIIKFSLSEKEQGTQVMNVSLIGKISCYNTAQSAFKLPPSSIKYRKNNELKDNVSPMLTEIIVNCILVVCLSFFSYARRCKGIFAAVHLITLIPQ